MNTNVMKRVISSVLASVLFLSTPMELLADQLPASVSKSVSQLQTGLMKTPIIDGADPNKYGGVYDYEVLANTSNYSVAYESGWDIYASNYYYNQLDSEWQQFWDALTELNTYYIESTDYIDGYMGFVSLPEPMTRTDLGDFMEMYLASNPQYYFIYAWGPYTNAQGLCTSASFWVYDAFRDGQARKQATSNYKDAMGKMLVQMLNCKTDVEKVRTAHDLICQNVTYNDPIYADEKITNEEEQAWFSQSSYSAFYLGTTVCAGYADAMTVLCNAAGVDALCVASYNHAWNKVRINGTWYNLDTTWADQKSGIYYKYMYRSDAFYSSDHASHVELPFWKKVSPKAIVDLEPVGLWSAPGTPQVASQKAATPVITENAGMVTITSSTPDAEIYYTLNGSAPGVAAVRSFRYNGPFYLPVNTQLQAIAVCNQYLDSAITSYVSTNKYKINYELNGGTNHPDNPTGFRDNEAITLVEPTRIGYRFGGWCLDASLNNPVTGVVAGTAKDVTFYAKWVPIQYKIQFVTSNVTNVTGTPVATMICDYDTEYSLNAMTAIRYGYDFTGWNTKSNGSGTAYADKQKIKNLTTEDGAVITLYARWKTHEYTIKYVLNGGINHPDNPDTCLHGGVVYYSKPTREGYQFAGWYKDSAFENKTVGMGPENVEDVTLYAKWTPNTYTIAFNGNGASSGSMNGVVAKYDEETQLTKSTFVRDGYKFSGWNTKADGTGTFYASGAKVKNLTTENNAKVTLYAQWKPLENYHITYVLNGGKNVATNPDTYMEGKGASIYSPTRTGYTFAGWYSDPDFEIRVTGISSNMTGDITIYAKWKANKYEIYFDGNGATSGSMTSASVNYDSPYTLNENKFTRKNYVFNGWNTRADGKGTAYTDKASVKNLSSKNYGSVILYAQWKLKSYKITYVLDNGKNNSANPASYTIKSKTITLKSPTRTGYTFKGWYSDSAKTKKVTELKTGSSGDKKLYAKWSVNKYNIQFNANGGSGTMSAKKNVTYTTKVILTNKFKKTGYTFAGWATSKDGSVKYKNSQEVSKLRSKNGDTITLYAKWNKNKYNIKFNANGGTGTMSTQKDVAYDKKVKLTNKFKKTGYTFAGWATSKDGSVKYKNSQEVSKLTSVNKKTVTLYAKWTKNKYKITYNLNKGKNNSSNPASYTVTDKTITLKTPTRSGYTFKGWYKESTFKTRVKTIEKGSTGNLTLYAKWVKKK